MSCHNCGNQSHTSGCQGCGTCGDPCDPCSDQDSDLACQARQIEQLANRTDQLKAQIEELNTGVPFESLCLIQECASPDCANTGIMCEGGSPTGRPVGAGGGESCCGEANPANTQDFCDELAKKIRLFSNRLTKVERQYSELRNKAVGCILLDQQGNTKGWLTVSGELQYAAPGSWELALEAQA